MALWQRWQYITKIIYADINNSGSSNYFDKNWPTDDDPPKHTPESMIPLLDDFGENGWELIHMEPIPSVGKANDIGFPHGGSLTQTTWSNAYFCVFKRPKMPNWEYSEYCKFCMQIIEKSAKVCPYCGREKVLSGKPRLQSEE